MNNNVVEKTLKSIDNIDRLSDLAAISIYNTSHEAIDKFDVMQEHATPEYVEGEFVQESLLTGVLIGAGIIGVAISAFLIIKKIIESKAKGDPNAAPNSIKGVDLRNPDDIDKAFTKWEKEYFGKHPDMVIENIKGASPSALGTYAETLTKETNDFITSVNGIIESFMSGTESMATDEQMVQQMHEFAESLKGAINIDQLESANITKDTIGILKSDAISIAKSFREFDNKINESIKTFEARSKQQHADSEDVKNATETMVKNFSNALKTKAKEIGAIMDSIRSIFEGFQTAIENKVKELGAADTKREETEAKEADWAAARKEAEQRAAEGTIDPIKVKEAIQNIKSSRKLFKKTDDEIRSDLMEYGFTGAEIDEAFKAVGENSSESPKEPTGGPGSGPNPSQDDKSANSETDETSTETENSEKHEGTPENTETSSDNPEDKIKETFSKAVAAGIDETAAGLVTRGDVSGIASALGKFDLDNPEDREQYIALYDNLSKALDFFNLASLKNIPENGIDKFMTPDEVRAKYKDTSSEDEIKNKFDDTQVTPEKIEAVVSAVEARHPDLVVTEHDRKYIDWFLSANDKDTGVSSIIEILERVYKDDALLNSNEAGKIPTFKKYLYMAEESAKVNGLDTQEIKAAFPQNRIDLLGAKSEDITSEGEKSGEEIKTLTDEEKAKLISAMQSYTPGFNEYSFNRIYDNLKEGTPETITKDIAIQAFEQLLFDTNDTIDLRKSGKIVNEILINKYSLYKFIANEVNIDFSKFNIERPSLSRPEFNQLVPIFDDVKAGKKTPYQGINDATKILLAKYGFNDSEVEPEKTEEPANEAEKKDETPSAEETTATPETPKTEDETSSEESTPEPKSDETAGNEIKRISDVTGLDESKVENIYKILKNNTTPDDIKRALIIDTISPIMHMPGFNQDMANESFATNYTNFKKVAEAANIPFEIEQPKISEKDINNIHTIVDGAGTDETKLAKIADNLMKSTLEPEDEILNTADTIDTTESTNQDQNESPTQITSDDLISAKNADIDETTAERIAYAINNNKDMTSSVVAPAMGTLLADINERPLNSVEQSQYLKTYDDLVKAFNYFHLDPNQYLDPEKYPDPKSLGIISDEEKVNEPKAQPSSPSNSSTGSGTGSNRRPAGPKQGAGQPVRKPVNKSGSNQQPVRKPGSGAKPAPAKKQGIIGKLEQFLRR